jgi:DNA repair exonuclease SbcCD nuclease subunit
LSKINFLHTADWHLKPNHKYTSQVEGKIWDRLCEEKLKVLRRIPAIADKYNCPIVVIAGDVFDTSNPPEALKAEFCKILNSLDKRGIQTVIIPGRPGDHDFVADNNFVLMDIREAYSGSDNIYIHDQPHYELEQGILVAHYMLEGISEYYRNVVKYTDPIFKDYQLILMGDYHANYVKKYGGKVFTYSGPPYQTRFGEGKGTMNVVSVDSKTHSLLGIKKLKIPSFQLITKTDMDWSVDDIMDLKRPFVLRFQLIVDPSEVSDTIKTLTAWKDDALTYDNCMDMVWEVKTTETVRIGESEGTAQTPIETCMEYIQEKAKFKKTTAKIFKRIEASL